VKFIKKPVVIDAWQWDECKDTFDLLISMGMKSGGHESHHDYPDEIRRLRVKTLEGTSYIANRGDWIIKGIKGEFYPCKPDIFKATYKNLTPSRRGR
jgi:hypothetical protein